MKLLDYVPSDKTESDITWRSWPGKEDGQVRLHKAEKMAIAEQLRSGCPHPEPGLDQKKGRRCE